MDAAPRPLDRWLPGLAVARTYERSWLRTDLTAGVVLTALLIPAGMGYAEAAGLPPVTGLYATVVPLIAYALFGPSRILVLGPDSSLAPIIGASILPLAAGDPDRAIALAGLLSILMGLVLIASAFVRLGFVTDLLSKPIRLGYLNGIALIVAVGQLPKLLGVEVDGDSLLEEIRQLVIAIADGGIDPTTAAVGVASLAAILVPRWLGWRVPGVLLAVIGATAATAVWNLDERIAVVGALPGGLPAPALGGIGWSDVVSLAGPAAGIALIAFADTGVLSRTFAMRRGEVVRGDDEMRGIGAANVASGLLGGFPISASSSRTPVAEQAGAQSQLVGVVGAVLIVVFMLTIPGVTEFLPSAALAAVVLVAATSLVDLPGLLRLAKMSRTETALSLAAFAGVALVGVLQGIVVAVALSFVAFVHQAWQPYRTELVRVKGLKGYHDVDRHPEGDRIPGLVIARFDAPLFFANGAIFDDHVRALVDAAPWPVRMVVVAAEPITGVDTTAMDELVELDDHLARHGIALRFAEMKGPVKDRLVRLGLGDRFPEDHFFPTIGVAVRSFVDEFGVDWVDWDDRSPGDRPDTTDPTDETDPGNPLHP